jgi:hypothetical protein
MLSPQRFVQIAGLLLLVGGAGVCRAAADNRDGEGPAAKVKRYREQRATLLEQIKALEDKGANRTVEENAALAARLTQVRQVETSLANLIGGGPKLGEIKGAAPGGIGNNPGGIDTGTGGLDRAGAGTRGLDGAGAGTSELDGAGAGAGVGEGKGPAPAGIRDNPGGLATGGAGTGPGGMDNGGTGLGNSRGPAPAGIRDNPGGLAVGGAGTGPGEMDTGGTGLGNSRRAVPEGLRRNPGDLATGADEEDEEEDTPAVSPEGDGTQDTAGGRSLRRPGSGPKLGEAKGAVPEGLRQNPGDLAIIGGLATTEEELRPPRLPPGQPQPPPKAGLAATEEGLRPPRLPPGQPPPPPKAELAATIASSLMKGLSFDVLDRKLDEATAREGLKALGAQVAKLQNSIGFKQGGEGLTEGVASPLGLGKLAQGLLSQPLQKREDFASVANSLERLLGSLQARLKGGAQAQSGVGKGAANRSELGADEDRADSGRGGLQGAVAAELRGLGPSIEKQVTALGSYNDNWTPEQKEAYMGQLNALQNKIQMLSNLNQALHDMSQGVIQNVR